MICDNLFPYRPHPLFDHAEQTPSALLPPLGVGTRAGAPEAVAAAFAATAPACPAAPAPPVGSIGRHRVGSLALHTLAPLTRGQATAATAAAAICYLYSEVGNPRQALQFGRKGRGWGMGEDEN